MHSLGALPSTGRPVKRDTNAAEVARGLRCGDAHYRSVLDAFHEHIRLQIQVGQPKSKTKTKKKGHMKTLVHSYIHACKDAKHSRAYITLCTGHTLRTGPGAKARHGSRTAQPLRESRARRRGPERGKVCVLFAKRHLWGAIRIHHEQYKKTKGVTRGVTTGSDEDNLTSAS